jgi:two-component system, NarL family, response regulator DevR
MSVRVALVDDHEIVSFAIAAATETTDRLSYWGVAATVDDLLARDPHPDLVVLDLRLADGSSPIGNVDKLRAAGAAVVAFTSGENPYLVRLAARTPVLGIVRKSAPIATLVETLVAAAEGQVVMSADWAAAIDSDPTLDDAQLSPREQEVLALLATGSKSIAIASSLGIAVSTVDDYVRRIRAKYARAGRPALTRIDLYKRALEDGFLPLPGAE